MKHLLKFIFKPIITGGLFMFGAIIVYAATQIISSVKDGQTINNGDTIGSGWFQDVNDKLYDLSNNINISGGNIGIGTTNPSKKLVVKNGKTSIEQEDRNNPSLENGWTVHNESKWASPQYYKDSMNRVHIKGLVEGGSLGSCVFTLPSGYRTSKDRLFIADTTYNDGGTYQGGCMVEIKSNGCIYINTTCDSSRVSLEGISFRTQ